ncbi:hypothetical protein HY570_04300 [Candidatus Micrarchaeota archaeon]|nr:hypothetical protein [Candidatus Micrarchaeota archaeon]
MNMHATMLDTFPPITYLNDISKRVIEKVHELNNPRIIAGYTFDAGPNAHVFTLQRYVGRVVRALKSINGVERIFVCKVGEGPKYFNNRTNHLIDPETGGIR